MLILGWKIPIIKSFFYILYNSQETLQIFTNILRVKYVYTLNIWYAYLITVFLKSNCAGESPRRILKIKIHGQPNTGVLIQ